MEGRGAKAQSPKIRHNRGAPYIQLGFCLHHLSCIHPWNKTPDHDEACLVPRAHGTLPAMVGGFPIDRSGSQNVVAQSIQAFNEHTRMVMVVPPSGTRKKVMYWKTGFYHIARGAGVPVVLGYLDYRQKVGGIGPTVHITGHMEADMKTIRGFYADIKGKYPRKNGDFFVVSESKMLP